jgi:hypothetical protein
LQQRLTQATRSITLIDLSRQTNLEDQCCLFMRQCRKEGYFGKRVGELANQLFSLVDRHVVQTGYVTLFGPEEMDMKIDLLERTLEVLRIQNKRLENNLPLEEFVQGKIGVGEDRLVYSRPERYRHMGSGTPPIKLQSKLLLFLLIHHQNHLSVYDIIDSFVRKIWDDLELLDFKKTRTGVIRCFTNTRFAAHTLRDYGLLQFTKREAYKTWTLSLPGFVAAARVMASGNWSIPDVQKKLYFNLHPDILDAFEDLKDYELFVQRLAAMCKPGTTIFDDFKTKLQGAYSYLDKYWQVMNDASIPKEQRAKHASEILSQLEQNHDFKEFYKELTALFQIVWVTPE